MTKRTRASRKRTRVSVELQAALTLLAVAACHDSARPADDNALTDAEVVALVDGLAVVGGLTGVAAATPVVDPPPADCPLGGTAGLLRRVVADTVAPVLVLSSDLVMTPRNCQFTARGATFTVNGAPDVRQSGQVRVTGHFERAELDWEVVGAVEWETDSPARRGRCSLDLDLTGEVELPGVGSTDPVAVVRGTLSGTACDAAVNLPLGSIGGG